MYGLDGPALLLMPLLWLLAGIWPALWLCVAALIVDVVFLVVVLRDRGWFLDRDKRWLHVALTVLPAVAVGCWTLPQLIGAPEAAHQADLQLTLPAMAAALGAVLNLYFAVVPHER